MILLLEQQDSQFTREHWTREYLSSKVVVRIEKNRYRLESMRKMPEIHNTKLLAQTRLFNVEAIDLVFSNGMRRTYERLRSRYVNGVMIIPITEDEHFLLIREYAGGIEDYELTFPKGHIDPGESVEIAVARELQEEVGFDAKDIQILKSLIVSPAYMASQLTIVLARDLYPKKLIGDEPEPLEIVKWPVANYIELLQLAEFRSAMSVAALLLSKEILMCDS